jgi:hypothetical protein
LGGSLPLFSGVGLNGSQFIKFMKKERCWLMEAIRSQLLPEFLARGFVLTPLPRAEQGPTDREFLVSFPFGRLRRSVDHGFEQVEIQLAPRGRAAFRLNFGLIPTGGVKGGLGHIVVDDAGVHSLPERFALYSCPFFSMNFSVRRWMWSKRERTEDEYRALVARVVDLLPEIEDALRNAKIGPHIRHTVIKG